MNRTIVPAVAAAMLTLAACSSGQDSSASEANKATAADNMAMDEDVSADGLAAPSEMPLDSESNSVGSASGGNAM